MKLNNVINESYIKLPNSIYDNLNITNEEITILLLMYRNYMQYKSIAICSVQLVCDYMYINISNNRKIISLIKDTINSLIKKEYIIKLYDIYYDNYDNVDLVIKDKDSIFYVELAPPPEDKYFIIYDRDINYIFKEMNSKNLNKFNLIRYYIACKRVTNNNSNFGYLSQGKLKQLVNDSRTIQRYNNILQDELQLIRYCNDYLTKEKQYCTTFIGNYDDEENFNHQVQFEVDRQGLIHTDKIISNKKRSIKQKINHLIDEKDIKIKELEDKIRQYELLQFNVKNEDEDSDDTFDIDDLDFLD